MKAARQFLRPLGRQMRRRPLRLWLSLAQLALAAAVITVAVHVVQAERSQRYAQDLFMVRASAPRGQIVWSADPFTVSTLPQLLELSPDVANLAIHSFVPGLRQKIEVAGETFMLPRIGRVDLGYLFLMGIEVTAGSLDMGGGAAGGRQAILLEEGVAATLFHGDDPIGQELRFSAVSGDARPSLPHRVVATYRYAIEPDRRATDALARHPALIPTTAAGGSSLLVLTAPGRGEAAREQIVAASPQVYAAVLRQHDGMDVSVQEASGPPSFAPAVNPHLLLFSLFGITALVLAALGVFSTTVVDVTEQTHEIGVQRALGASSWRIAKEYALVAGMQALTAGLVGAVAALALVPALSRELGDALLPGVQLSGQPLIAISALAFVTLLSTVLGLLPALHAGRLRPADAIREA